METAAVQTALPATTATKRGWTVALSGLGINLALGVLYTWSVFKPQIKADFKWDDWQLNDPYALCCVVFALAMIVAGRCQDKLGPRLTATIGGVLVGAGLILISQSSSYAVWLLGFGVLVGIGLGFGYSSATPPALKWFPPAKTGLIAGLVVAGFGLAPVYLSPTAKYLLKHYQVQNSMLILGAAFLVVVCCLAQMLVNPPAGFVPASGGASGAAKPAVANASPAEILRQPQFWVLWVIYFIGAGAGLMVIGSINGMATKRLGAELAFLAVAATAVGNASGRIGAGFLSDKIGRRWTLMLVLAFQAVLMFAAIPVTGSEGAKAAVLLVATLMGLNYGANLSLFPSLAKDLWGLKNFGMNYGVLFTAWGAGSLLSLVSQRMYAASKSYDSSFEAAGGLLILGALLTFAIRQKRVAATQ